MRLIRVPNQSGGLNGQTNFELNGHTSEVKGASGFNLSCEQPEKAENQSSVGSF